MKSKTFSLLMILLLGACTSPNEVSYNNDSIPIDSCNYIHEKRNQTIDTIRTTYESIEYRIDTLNPQEIGFKKIEERFKDIGKTWYYGINSILLVDNKVYLTDAYHGNIKEINLNTKVMKASQILGRKGYQSMLNNVILFKEKFFILTGAFTNYILEKNFHFKDSFHLKRGNKNIYNIDSNHINIYTSDYILHVDSVGNVSETTLHKINYELLNTVHGKSYRLNNSGDKATIQTQYGIVVLEGKFPVLTYYEGKNFDFNDKRLVIFEITPKIFRLHIYTYKNSE